MKFNHIFWASLITILIVFCMFDIAFQEGEVAKLIATAFKSAYITIYVGLSKLGSFLSRYNFQIPQ